MALWILRAVFLLSATGVSYAFISTDAFEKAKLGNGWLVFIGLVAIALVIVGADLLIPRKRIEVISCIYVGIVVGLFLGYVVGIVIEPLLAINLDDPRPLAAGIRLIMSFALCYICISVLFQTKDDFRFIIPYVEFSKEVKGVKPYILDTSVVIDGRIADVVETNIFDNQLIMPRFVLGELQGIADSGDKLKRSRGRRGLDILNRLRNSELVDLKIYDREHPEMSGQPVDMKLVLLAKRLDGKIVTGDYNLNKVARLHNVQVINLNDIANSLKPVFLPGETVDVKIVKAGEEPGQGVGYLDDGTMIVVESGREQQGETVKIVVTSVLTTSAGRMIFGRFEGGKSDKRRGRA